MVEQNDQGANPQIEWPRGIAPDPLQSLLEENQRGTKLRSVVAGQLRRESDSLSSTLGSQSHPSIDGFIIVATELNNSLEFVDSDKDTTVEGITDRLFVRWRDFGTVDRLGLLAEALDQYRRLVPEIEINEGSELPRHLVETMQRAEILRKNQTGFELVDYLAAQNAYPPNHSNFEQEKLGRGKAAERYKELSTLLIDNGATSD